MDVCDVLEALDRIAIENEEACIISYLQMADLAFRKDRSGCVLGPELEQRAVVQSAEGVTPNDAGEIRPYALSDRSPLRQLHAGVTTPVSPNATE